MNSNLSNEKMEQSGVSNITLNEIWHTFVSHIIWEVLVVLLILIAGFAYSTTASVSYVASARIVIEGKSEEGIFGPENTSLTKSLASDIAEIVGSPEVNAYLQNNGYCDLSGSSQSASVIEDSIVMSISYRHSTKAGAETGLTDYVKYFNVYLEETGTFSNFGKFNIRPISGFDNFNPTASMQSSRTKIIVLTVVVAFAALCVYVIIAMIIGNRISSVSRLEAVSGKKNLIAVGKVQSKGKDKSDVEGNGKLVTLKLDKLSDTLIFMQDADNNKIYQIQSTYAGEGKTTVTCNLARAIGASQRKVLILDCDFAHPSVHKFLDLPREFGLTEYAKKKANFDEVVKKTAFENVDLITCGEIIPNHTVMFKSPAFVALLEEAKKVYDFILLDCAPVKAMSDYISVSQLVEATIVVVESDKVKAKDLTTAINDLNACGANVIGTVFNCSRVSKSDYYNYYYYQKKKEQEKDFLA